VGVLLSLTKNASGRQRDRIALRSSVFSLAVLAVFALSGFLIFQVYSITIDAFRIAGGMILLVIGMRMLFPGEEAAHSGDFGGKDIYIVPLGIPMTSGPGTITTAVVLASQAGSAINEAMLFAAIVAACLTNYLVLREAGEVQKRLGNDGVSALIKIMGLLVCAVGVQFVINGLKAAFPLLGGA
jgi:multiple antibiotic resistance protein